jgi:hypothetical protein
MTNPFLIHGPAQVNFSGGETSAYMLWQMVQAHGGQLPDDVFVCFANTGKERPETLRFVHDCATHWGVRIRWLEFTSRYRKVGAAGRVQEVGYNSAARNGEPLALLIEQKKTLFSTMRGRMCTEFCKVQPLHDFMELQGYKRGQYTEVIGFRADERDRVFELPRRPRNVDRRFVFPLAEAGQRKADVTDFWAGQPFRLQLRKGTGNCDHCPFLGNKQRIARARLDPDGLDWWGDLEVERGMTFGWLSIDQLRREVERSPMLLDDVEQDAADSECVGWCG